MADSALDTPAEKPLTPRQFDAKVLETTEKSSPGLRFGGPGPGRPKGRQNNVTLQQRRVAEMVLGKPGTPEFEAFVMAERLAALDQSMAPGVKILWMHYLLGKPVEKIEVKDTSDDLDVASTDNLRERAKKIASRIVEEPQSESSVTH